MTVREIREQAAFQAEEARKIKDLADQESRGMTAEEALDFDKHLIESERLEKEAERQEKLELAEARINKPKERVAAPELANGKRIETPGRKMFRFGKLQSFKGANADINAYRSGKWLMATVMGNAEARQWCHDHGVELRVQTEAVNAAGGFVVPDEFERAVIDLRETYGLFRANARVVPMASDHMLIPRRAGGVTAYFIGETTAITASDKSWNQVELTAKKLGALTRMSSELSEDAIINVADDLANEMAYAFALKEDQCGIDGDGTNTYGGMVGLRALYIDGFHTAGNREGTSTCEAWTDITLADEIINTMALLPTYAQSGAKWYIHPTGKAGTFDALALAGAGNTTVTLASGAQPMFAGYPVVVSSVMPTIPVDQDTFLLFGDMKKSTTLGDRRGITVKVSDQRYLEFDQIGIQATERFCIVHHDIGDATTAGPLVGCRGNS